MKFVALFVLTAGMSVVDGQELCCDGHEEEQFDRVGLGETWPVSKKLDCSRENIDAATTLPDGQTFFFKDGFYWRMQDSDVDPGYPRCISQDWDGLPGNLDAALTRKDGRTFFFKGHQYWSFHGMQMQSGYPRNIRDGFCGIPNNLDAALLWKNKAYFFKGNQYWRYDSGQPCTRVRGDYPKSIREWEDIPYDVDAAMQWRNGRTYFFKGGYYYRYNDDGTDSDAGRPIKIHRNWGLKCSELNRRIASLEDYQLS